MESIVRTDGSGRGIGQVAACTVQVIDVPELPRRRPQLAAADLPALVEQARDQLRRLETVRLDAARQAFTAVD